MSCLVPPFVCWFASSCRIEHGIDPLPVCKLRFETPYYFAYNWIIIYNIIYRYFIVIWLKRKTVSLQLCSLVSLVRAFYWTHSTHKPLCCVIRSVCRSDQLPAVNADLFSRDRLMFRGVTELFFFPFWIFLKIQTALQYLHAGNFLQLMGICFPLNSLREGKIRWFVSSTIETVSILAASTTHKILFYVRWSN